MRGQEFGSKAVHDTAAKSRPTLAAPIPDAYSGEVEFSIQTVWKTVSVESGQSGKVTVHAPDGWGGVCVDAPS
jgi:hypothetical protein